LGLIMFPAAVISAFASRIGGRLADTRGNVFLIWTAASLSLAGLLLLSSFAGAPPIVLGVLLILPYVSFILFNLGMSNAVSATLSKDQTGVGMGMFSMLNFIAGAIATGVAGRSLDSVASFHLNPF